MLYFSKIKIIIISILSIFFIILTSSNFLSSENNFFKKKINLGLDLQGGSYLLLEIDNNPVIVRNLQNSLSNIRKYFKTNNISFKNLKVNNQTIIFDIDNNNIDTIKTLFLSEDSEINPYDQKFKSHQFDLLINNNTYTIDLCCTVTYIISTKPGESWCNNNNVTIGSNKKKLFQVAPHVSTI